jgi:glycosyltransferase involved in cell wall biosynthesis
MVKPTLNFFWPSTVIESGGKHYISRPWYKNGLSTEFELKLFCKISSRDKVNKNKYLQLSDNIEVVDFFKETNTIDFLANYFEYKKEIQRKTDLDSELYFVMYPYRKISIFIANILRDTDLTIWVQSNYVDQFAVHDNQWYSTLFKRSISPAISLIYPQVTERLLQGNVVFYTGNILYNCSDHVNQYEITSVSPLNRNNSLVKDSMTGDVVFVGGESNIKGLEYLLKSLERTNLELSLTIIGCDELTRYAKYTEELDIDCVGTIYDHDLFYEHLADNDVLVMPSIAERQGKVQIEAMSAGVVPICADSDGIYTTIDSYYNGLLFEKKNVRKLTERLEEVYKSPTLYRELQENGLEYTSSLHLSKQIDKMSTIIKNHYTNQNRK